MAHKYNATILWKADGDFARGTYSRAHTWEFDGGTIVPASSSPLVVPLPWSETQAVDPEEAFVAAVSSCHMLWFLDLARRAGFIVTCYEDRATAQMEGTPTPWIQRVDLNPTIQWGGEAPDAATLAALHDDAHENCFIARSIKSEVVVHS